MDDAEFRQQAWVAGINPDAAYSVVAAEPLHGRGIRARIDEIPWPRGTVIADYGLRVIVVAPTHMSEELSASWHSKLDGTATAGVGSTVSAPRLAASYREAHETLEVMTALGQTGHIGTSADLGLYRILLGGARDGEVAKLIEDTLGPLLEEEARRGVSLLDTLSEYLRRNQRRAATADALNIHVNTLYQRLRAIDRVLGPDWKDNERAVDLQVLLRLRASSTRLHAIRQARLPDRPHPL
ncbi:PucR family transcriptional regulator [Rhodococcus indonesiensis]